MAYKIGVLGDKDSVTGFKAIGLLCCACDNRAEAVQGLKLLASECAIIYVVEETAMMISDEIHAFDTVMTPAVILIPGNRGSLGIGMKMLNESVEKAVGSNVLNN